MSRQWPIKMTDQWVINLGHEFESWICTNHWPHFWSNQQFPAARFLHNLFTISISIGFLTLCSWAISVNYPQQLMALAIHGFSILNPWRNDPCLIYSRFKIFWPPPPPRNGHPMWGSSWSLAMCLRSWLVTTQFKSAALAPLCPCLCLPFSPGLGFRNCWQPQALVTCWEQEWFWVWLTLVCCRV